MTKFRIWLGQGLSIRAFALLASLLVTGLLPSVPAVAAWHASSAQFVPAPAAALQKAGYTQNWLVRMAARAEMAHADGDYHLSARLWTGMAEIGDLEAAYRLGMLHDQGQGVERDAARAVYWYQRAAAAGHPHAQHNLAVAYANGSGVGRDMPLALRWWQRAARQGNHDSQYNLGILYATGRGVGRDLALAMYWWRMAAQSGDPQAQYNLGMLYANAQGRARSYCEAMRWWQESAKNGIAQARVAMDVIRQRQDFVACR